MEVFQGQKLFPAAHTRRRKKLPFDKYSDLIICVLPIKNKGSLKEELKSKELSKNIK